MAAASSTLKAKEGAPIISLQSAPSRGSSGNGALSAKGSMARIIVRLT